MTKIVNLNELLPPDIVFQWGEGDKMQEYRVPGDLDVETVFVLYDKFAAISDARALDPDAEERADETEKAIDQLQEALLEIFKVHQPDMRKLPFGIRGTAVVVSHILQQLNQRPDGDDGDALPPISPPSSPKKATSLRTGGKRRPSPGSRS